MDEAGLADVAEDGGGVEGCEGEGLGADAAVDDLGVGVGGEGVVVLEHGALLGDAPCEGAEAGATGVGVGEAVDAAPGVLGLVVGLAVGVGVEPAAEGGDDVVVAVVLAGDLGAEVALEGGELAARHVGGHPGGVLVEVGAQRVGVLAGGGVDGGIAGVLLGEEARVRVAVDVGGALEADVGVPGGAGGHAVLEGERECGALGEHGELLAGAGEVVGTVVGVGGFGPGCIVGDAEGAGFAEGSVGGTVFEVKAFGESGGVAEGWEGGGSDAVNRGRTGGGEVADLEEAGSDDGEVGRGPGGGWGGVSPGGGGRGGGSRSGLVGSGRR